MRRVLFLPGASGAGAFWRPVADRLPAGWQTTCLDLPGLGDVPPRPGIDTLHDLVALVLDVAGLGPLDLVAQSMGGVIAMRAVLENPAAFRRLVLVATSGGVDLTSFEVEDWRTEYRRNYPNALAWITRDHHADLSDRLEAIAAPTLLIWGGADGISPPAVGAYLQSKLPNARLVVVPDGDHMFARDRPDAAAPHILQHLGA